MFQSLVFLFGTEVFLIETRLFMQFLNVVIAYLAGLSPKVPDLLHLILEGLAHFGINGERFTQAFLFGCDVVDVFGVTPLQGTAIVEGLVLRMFRGRHV